METRNDLVQRVATLEKEVAELKRHLPGGPGIWPDKVFGRMTGFPEFEDVVRLGKQLRDAHLRIAPIALSHGFTVLTRNTVDYSKVAGLRVEDWTTGN